MTQASGGAGRGRWRRMVAALVCLAALAAANPSRAAELVDRVLAVVSGTIITLSDARLALDLGFVEPAGSRDRVGTALDWLIRRRLVLDEAQRYDAAEVDLAAVEASVWVARRRFASDEAWAAAKRRLGVTDDDIRAFVTETLAAEQFVERRFGTAPTPPETEIRSYYDAHRQAFVRDGRQLSFDEAMPEATAAVDRVRRAEAERDWLARLRRRADVSELYAPAR